MQCVLQNLFTSAKICATLNLAKEKISTCVQSESPRMAVLRLSFWADCCGLISIQPLAYVIANHTRHDRANKRKDFTHVYTSFPLERVNSVVIITSIDIERKFSNFPPKTLNQGVQGSSPWRSTRSTDFWDI